MVSYQIPQTLNDRQKDGQRAKKTYINFEQSKPPYNSFWGIEKLLPLQLAILLGDSPVGNNAWPYLGMRLFSPGYEWGVEELITWGMMLYIQGPYGSTRIYAELESPVGVLEYYGDASYGAPQSWCERTGNGTYFVEKPKHVLG